MAEAGHETFGASTSSEALDLAGRVHPEVAVLDIGLPDMSGLELARALRTRANGASLRLIALTGYGRAQDEASARAAGFDAFFVKPVDIPTLLDALDRPHAGGQTPASAELPADR
jgi:CheY-like chemotaxis protein